MNGFPSYVPGLCECLRDRVLNTSINMILLVPALAQHLETEPQMVQIGSWQYSMREAVEAGRDILDCLPNNPADGFQLSCFERKDGSVDVQLHEGKHRMVALYQESPKELCIGDLVGKIKFIHCHRPTEFDVSHLAACDHIIEDNMIEYWFTPKKGMSHQTVKDPGHDNRTMGFSYTRSAIPVSFRDMFSPRVVQISDVSAIPDEFLRPHKLEQSVIAKCLAASLVGNLVRSNPMEPQV